MAVASVEKLPTLVSSGFMQMNLNAHRNLIKYINRNKVIIIIITYYLYFSDLSIVPNKWENNLFYYTPYIYRLGGQNQKIDKLFVSSSCTYVYIMNQVCKLQCSVQCTNTLCSMEIIKKNREKHVFILFQFLLSTNKNNLLV